ncbi:MAG TPA: LysR family transcriptional regulator [Polyangiaceae bacterium]|nr:LysR family transcriptional regulator [Polyangiaceae bacterium]
MQSKFSWDDVRVMLALFRAKSLSGAATALGVNASTVGRRLDALEEALGVHLFDRTPDGVLPTAVVERLIPHAESFEHAALGLGNAVDGFETKPEGIVRLTAAPGVADHFVAPALPRLLAKHPGIRLELDSSIAHLDLSRREADLALRFIRPTSGDLVTRKIADEEDAILASPDYVERVGVVAAFTDIDWITWGSELAHIPSARWLTEAVPSASVVFRTSSIAAQIAAAEAGTGAILLPRIFMRGHRLVEVRLSPELYPKIPRFPHETLWLVGHRALRDVPRIAAVWQFIVDEIEGPA